MKKRILSIILAICMMITLVPMMGVVNAADSVNEAEAVNYNGYFVCGSELINNGAGNGITSLNRMTKVAPNVYEFTVDELRSFLKK